MIEREIILAARQSSFSAQRSRAERVASPFFCLSVAPFALHSAHCPRHVAENALQWRVTKLLTSSLLFSLANLASKQLNRVTRAGVMMSYRVNRKEMHCARKRHSSTASSVVLNLACFAKTISNASLLPLCLVFAVI